jgi:mono/diheme cytochrome c family protein
MIERYVSPSELKRLVSALLVVVLFIGLLATFGFLILPGLRNANKPSAGTPFSAAGGGTGWLDPTDYPPERGRTLPPIDPATVMTATPALLAKGQTLFDQNCASCHGPKGEGNGPAGKGLNPPPRNFTHPEGWKNGPTRPGIFKTLEEGVKGSSMVSYGYLNQRDRMSLVHYVQSLGHFDHGAEDPKAVAALANRFASSGEVIPNRIPVHAAMGKLEQEFRAPAPVASAADPILGRAIADPSRAALALAKLPGWRGSDQALAAGVAEGVPANGFRPSVVRFGPAEWRELRDALGRAVKEEVK